MKPRRIRRQWKFSGRPDHHRTTMNPSLPFYFVQPPSRERHRYSPEAFRARADMSGSRSIFGDEISQVSSYTCASFVLAGVLINPATRDGYYPRATTTRTCNYADISSDSVKLPRQNVGTKNCRLNDPAGGSR